jgi:hypothetical protein
MKKKKIYLYTGKAKNQLKSSYINTVYFRLLPK